MQWNWNRSNQRRRRTQQRQNNAMRRRNADEELESGADCDRIVSVSGEQDNVGRWHAAVRTYNRRRWTRACLAGQVTTGQQHADNAIRRLADTVPTPAAAPAPASAAGAHRRPAGMALLGRQMAQIDANIGQMHDKCYAHRRGWLGKLDWRTCAPPHSHRRLRLIWSYSISSCFFLSRSLPLSVCLSVSTST